MKKLLVLLAPPSPPHMPAVAIPPKEKKIHAPPVAFRQQLPRPVPSSRDRIPIIFPRRSVSTRAATQKSDHGWFCANLSDKDGGSRGVLSSQQGLVVGIGLLQ